MNARVSWTLCLTIFLIACDPDPPGSGEITWHRDVRPIVTSRCVGCHVSGGLAPFAFASFFRDVERRQDRIVAAVMARSMPPSAIDPTCRPVEGARWLADEELAVFASWRDGGFLEGNEDAYVPPEVFIPVVPPADLEFGIAEGYTADLSRPDDYRCIPVGDVLDRDSWLTRVEVLPDQEDLVHHVIVFVVSADDQAEMRRLDSADDGPGWTCFGDAGLDGAAQIGGWVPGAEGQAYQTDVGQRVAAGGQLVMQVHYSVAGRSTVASDHSQVALWRLPVGQVPAWQITTLPVADLGIVIPPGESESRQVSVRRMPLAGLVVGTSPHMHLLGRELRTEVIRPDGTVECLSGIQDWDFGWQQSYAFDTEHQMEVGPNDHIRLSCTYDNSERNQPVVNGERSDPVEVRWGDGTRDEMCLDYLVVLSPAADGFGQCAGTAACLDDCGPRDLKCAFACSGAAGIPCLDCVAREVFGPCAEAQCLRALSAAGSCIQRCEDPEADFFGCIYGDCLESTETLYECVTAAVNAGECPDTQVACEGWFR